MQRSHSTRLGVVSDELWIISRLVLANSWVGAFLGTTWRIRDIGVKRNTPTLELIKASQVNNLQVSRCGPEGSMGQGFKGSSEMKKDTV
jgi:hypothetical protein